MATFMPMGEASGPLVTLNLRRYPDGSVSLRAYASTGEDLGTILDIKKDGTLYRFCMKEAAREFFKTDDVGRIKLEE